jgi:hypothetical protein
MIDIRWLPTLVKRALRSVANSPYAASTWGFALLGFLYISDHLWAGGVMSGAGLGRLRPRITDVAPVNAAKHVFDSQGLLGSLSGRPFHSCVL